MIQPPAVVASPAAAAAAAGGHHLPGVRARRLLGGAAAVVRGSLAADGTLSLAAVEPSLYVLPEAVLWRGDRAGVGPVLAGIWVEEKQGKDYKNKQKTTKEKKIRRREIFFCVTLTYTVQRK